MNKKKFIAAGAAVGLAATLFAVAPAANAEPISVGPVIVGSDTLQDVVNALVNGTAVTGSNVRSTAGTTPASSFDATGSISIQTKANSVRFGRPNGSSDGVAALSRSIDGAPYTSKTVGGPANVTVTGLIDVARSSSGATAVSNGPLTYIPFGRDAFAYAHSGGSNAAFDSIDAATLKGIYECTVRTVGGVTVTPVIPQAGSGTRKDFLSKIGVTESSMLEVTEANGCVVVGQEHDTTSLSNGSAFPANAVAPMSAAQWVAQNTGAGVNRIGAGIELGSLAGATSPVTGSGTSMEPNPAYYSTQWGRDTYLVVETARVTSGNAKFDAKLANLLSSATTKLGNTANTAPTQAGRVKAKFGFLAPADPTPFTAALG